jgi:anti-sigma B factor antagonist
MVLNIARDEHAGHSVLVVDGELDLATAPQLTSTAMALVDAGAGNVIVDARLLSFCDSSGLTAFVRIANRLEPTAGRLAVVGPQAIVRRVLEISGLVETLVVVDSVDDAVAALDATARG